MKTPSRLNACVYSCIMLAVSMSSGCATFFTGGTDISDQMESETSFRLIGDVTRPLGLNWLKVESIALVTNLRGTGSDPRPSAQRNALENEMKTHDVQFPKRLLREKNTSMVAVRAYLPPAVSKGDRVDLEVFIPRKSESSSLEAGWLMRTRLREVRVLQGGLRTGHVIALGEGPVVTEDTFRKGDDAKFQRRGHVFGGGVARVNRKLGLAVRSKGGLDRTSALIGKVINGRFHTYEQGVKQGVARPKRDNFIELSVPSKYKYNISRYMRVIASLAIRESASERDARIEQLQQDILDPERAGEASLQLEAIGKDALPVLKTVVKTTTDDLVRFHAAEALAYLDDSDAAQPLAEAAQDRVLRWHALTALSRLSHVSGYHALTSLLDDESAETRYGAFRALRTRDRRAPLVKGELLNNEFRLHQIPGKSQPLVHISKSRRREVILFGDAHYFKAPPVVYAGKIMITAKGTGLKVSHFVVGKADRQVTCRAELGDLIRAVSAVGGSYSDVVRMIQNAKEKGYLISRVVVDAKPNANRSRAHLTKDQKKKYERVVGTAPLLFQRPKEEAAPDEQQGDEQTWDNRSWEDEEKPDTFFGRMTSWWK